jgi:hypothetical protein
MVAFADLRYNYTLNTVDRLAETLGIDPARLSVQSLQPVAASAGGSRRAGTSGAVDLSVVLLPDGSSSSQDAQGLVESSLSSPSAGLSVLGVQQQACGVCGNGICEAGERCDLSGGSGACCAMDCSLALSPCPSAVGSAVPCSGSGVCLRGSGVCACFAGYIGTACDIQYFGQPGSSGNVSSTPRTTLPGWATPPLRRGISVDRWLLSLPPTPGNGLTATQLQILASSGFDFLRLPVGPASLYNHSTGALFAARLSALDSAIDWVLASGLDVLVDLHFVSDSDKSRVLADPTAFSIYCTFAGNLAQHLTSSRPLARIALELFNEPHTTSNASAPAWPQLQNMLYSSVRAAAGSGLLLILTGDDFSSASGLSRLNPVNDGTPVAYGFHFYDPTPFTSQGATWGW